MKKTISVIVIKSREDQYREAEHWLQMQSCYTDMEIICLENENNVHFSSAAAALNHGAAQATGEILVFMHQDVYLWDTTILEQYRNFLSARKTTILGVAGADTSGTVYTDIYETTDKIRRNPPTNGQQIPVVSVDECLFAMHRELWQKLRFDPVCCDDWHCYAMDICFANTLAGGINLVMSFPICHDSLGNPEQKGFWRGIHRLVEKYRGTTIENITGCCVHIPCTRFAYLKYDLTHRILYPLNYRLQGLKRKMKK